MSKSNDNSGNGAVANLNRKGKPKQEPTLQAPTGPKLYSNRWMQKVYAEKPPFPDAHFDTIFKKEKIETLVAALKVATEKEVEESKRLLEGDYTYSVMIASHKVPHVPVHLSRM